MLECGDNCTLILGSFIVFRGFAFQNVIVISGVKGGRLAEN